MSRTVAVVALLLPALASAHALWAGPAGGGFVFRRGHRGGEVPPRDAARVTAVRCAAVRRPLASPKADALVLEASLAFPVAR